MKSIEMNCSKCKDFGQCGCEELREREYLRREGKDCFKLESKEKTMDIKKELQDLCDRYKAEVEKILEKAKMEKAEKKAWKPENGDSCYNILNSGIISHEIWFDDISMLRDCYAIGNCFPTKEAAEFAAEKLKVIAELKRFAAEHNEKIDWKNITQKKHQICYDHVLGKLYLAYSTSSTNGAVCFSSEEIAKAAIEAIGEERLKKYYFEVEE